MNRSTVAPRQLNWLFNAVQAVFGRGGQIDWSVVTNFFDRGKFTVKLGAGAAINATSLTVDALPEALQAGEILEFGTVATVVVTVNDADVNATETTITVTALSGPIPSGTILEFSGSGAGFAKLTAAAALGATTLTVAALAEDIDNAATATYQGGSRTADIAADAAKGATTLTVAPLPYAIANDAEAIFDGTGSDDGRVIKAGTVMARTSAGKLIPRYNATSETASEILQSDASENSKVDAKSGYGTLIEAYVYENLLPDADSSGDIPSAYKSELATNGARVNYMDWSDSRFTD